MPSEKIVSSKTVWRDVHRQYGKIFFAGEARIEAGVLGKEARYQVTDTRAIKKIICLIHRNVQYFNAHEELPADSIQNTTL